MSKTASNGFFNPKNKTNGMTQYQNNPNLSNFNQRLNKNPNNKMNYGGSNVNNLGGVGTLNIEGINSNNGNENGFGDMKKMNRTTVNFRPLKQTYEEKLDNFMASHNLKYVEPPKNEKKIIPKGNQTEPENNFTNNSNNGKKNNSQNSDNNNKKVINNKK